MISVSSQLRYSIIATVAINVMVLEMMLAKLLLISSLTVSMSLVNRLIRSPDWWVSKYGSGMVCNLANRSFRMAATERWEICTMIRA